MALQTRLQQQIAVQLKKQEAGCRMVGDEVLGRRQEDATVAGDAGWRRGRGEDVVEQLDVIVGSEMIVKAPEHADRKWEATS